jgi:4-amino-4-deoxy-L-arabinose transferase-like glycosyltransferase
MLSGTWLLPLIDRDEPRFAEASREMIQRGDFVVPRFNREYRFDKPPLIYWCQAAAYKLLGQNEFAARLPAVIFTIATAALLLGWTRKLSDPGVGVYTAIIFVTSLQVLIHGRMALADMPMIFFVTAAGWSGWELTRPGTPGLNRWWFVFFGSLALGFLAKGPVAWLPLVGVLVAHWRRPDQFRVSWPAIILGSLASLAVIAIWGVPALVATDGQFFFVGIGRHVVFRSLGIMEGHGGAGWIGYLLTLPLYLLTFFFSFFPWAFSVPPALLRWRASRVQNHFEWYLLVQAAIVFAVFTLVRTKLPHYILPAIPLLSLWLARQRQATPGAATWLSRRARLMCVLGFAITLIGFSLVRPYFAVARLFQQTRSLCSADTRLATVGFDEPSVVWQFRKVSTNYVQHLSPDQALPFLLEDGPRLLVLPEKDWTGTLTNPIPNSSTFIVRGLETAQFRLVRLVAIVKPGRQEHR